MDAVVNNFPEADNLPEDIADREDDDESTIGVEERFPYQTLDEATLPRVKRNDPELTALKFVGGDSEYIDWRTNASFISKNYQLTHLAIDCYTDESVGDDERTRANYVAFCRGVGENRSVESLRLSDSTFNSASTAAALREMAPLFSWGNLRSFELFYCGVDEGANSSLDNMNQLASALQSCHTLESICITGCEESVKGQMLETKLIETLDAKESLTKIHLRHCNMSWGSIYALGNILQNPECTVEDLDLRLGRAIDRTALAFLAQSMEKNNKSSTIRRLNLEDAGDAVSGPAGWKVFARSLQLHNCFMLEELNLRNNLIDDEGLAILESAVVSSTTLQSLNLRGNSGVSPEAWGSFLAVACTSALIELDVRNTKIEDVSVVIGLMAGLGSNTTLRKLLLSDTKIGCVGATALAVGLKDNSSLEVLGISPNEGIGCRSFGEFSRLVGNPSSIADTYASNHTLQSLGSCDGDCPRLPQLRYLLELNANNDKGKVARQKIILGHLLDKEGVNVGRLLDMQLSVLPEAVAWLGKDTGAIPRLEYYPNIGLALLYKLLLSRPTLVHLRTTASKKRKRDA